VDKGQVVAILEEVGNLLELSGGNPFETRAYQNAARTLGAQEGDIEEMVRDRSIERVPGLGKTLVARITELVTTGHMALYDELQEQVPPGLRQMLCIPGLGPKRIRQIHDALAISTVEQLKGAAESGQLATLPGFGAKSQEKILQGIAFLSEHQDKYRYDVAANAAEAILARLRALPQVVRIEVAGSIRRRKEVCKDMDIVASVARDEDRMPIMRALVESPDVASITGEGET
jgi:DNA polymerase (family 10)